MARWTYLAVMVALVGCSPPVSDPVVHTRVRKSSNPPAVTAVARPPKPDGWIEFVEPTNAFSIDTPAVPHSDSMVNVPFPGGMPGPTIYRGSGNGLSVYLSFFDRQPAEVPAIRATMYERGGTAGLAPLRTVTARRDITWVGQPAAKFEVQSGNITTVVRVLNVGNRFYAFHLAGQDGQPDAAAREAFFGSLSLRS